MTKILTKNEAASFLGSHDNYLILTHKRPDGDTLGSAAALTSALRRYGKTANMFFNKDITPKYLPFVQQFLASEDFDFSECTVISVDIADTGLFPAGAPDDVILAIDHHPSNSRFAQNLLLEDSRSACGEIVLDVINLLCGGVNKEEATLLYIALSTDTGCFVYANTDSHSFRTAGELYDAGAETAKVNRIFFRSMSKARLTLEGLVYSSLLSYAENRINIAVITKEMIEKSGATQNDMDDLASLPGKVEGNLVSAMIKENDQGFSKVSLRSNGAVNVSSICAMFGGGGHVMAAGCEMDMPPFQAAETLRKILEDSIKWTE